MQSLFADSVFLLLKSTHNSLQEYINLGRDTAAT